MKTFTSLMASVALMFFLALANRANAQVDLLSDLFSQMDPSLGQVLQNNFDSLNNAGNLNQNADNELFDQLNDHLLNDIPPGNFDANFQSELGSGLDTLLFHLPGLNLPTGDQDVLLSDIDWINNILNNNSDSLAGLFGQYNDSLYFDPSWDVTIIDSDDLNEEGNQFLADSINMAFDLSNPDGLGNFGSISDQLFDFNLFHDIELAFGTQDANLSYWGYNYSKRSKVFRIGSVPRFDKKVFNNNGRTPIFPVEARWHAEVSWFSGSDNTPSDTNPDAGIGRAFNPLLLFGDYSLMATPIIGQLGNTTFRLITSLGTEFGTYAPAHQDFRRPYTSNNKGYATGIGAQAGSGFAFSTGRLTVYSIATFAKGQTQKSAKTYPYSHVRYEVGMRYGNLINVRYSSGSSSWQTGGNRTAEVKNQFTVGIILAELHH
ncbi:MAG: hypothetical protein GC192_00300 [Bacteroidetes bacterium]|nr:hypothetical protein [Bacteroidota bacterium]